jgi:hypothetical protein
MIASILLKKKILYETVVWKRHSLSSNDLDRPTLVYRKLH